MYITYDFPIVLCGEVRLSRRLFEFNVLTEYYENGSDEVRMPGMLVLVPRGLLAVAGTP